MGNKKPWGEEPPTSPLPVTLGLGWYTCTKVFAEWVNGCHTNPLALFWGCRFPMVFSWHSLVHPFENAAHQYRTSRSTCFLPQQTLTFKSLIKHYLQWPLMSSFCFSLARFLSSFFPTSNYPPTADPHEIGWEGPISLSYQRGNWGSEKRRDSPMSTYLERNRLRTETQVLA